LQSQAGGILAPEDFLPEPESCLGVRRSVFQAGGLTILHHEQASWGLVLLAPGHSLCQSTRQFWNTRTSLIQRLNVKYTSINHIKMVVPLTGWYCDWRTTSV